MKRTAARAGAAVLFASCVHVTVSPCQIPAVPTPRAMITPVQTLQPLPVVNLPPTVEIIASKRVVRVGEKFNVRVIANSTLGLKAVWWFGVGTGIAELDKAHWKGLNGERSCDETWLEVSIDREGIYTLGANSRDVRYGVERGLPHQASEGEGIDTCVVDVRQNHAYEVQVDICRERFGKDQAWADWMKSREVRDRYSMLWYADRQLPTTVRIAYTYGERVAYDPRWPSEYEHMERLTDLAELGFPGMRFDFLYRADPAATDYAVKMRGEGMVSYSLMKLIYLYYEGIFVEECGHAFLLPHHYEGNDRNSPRIFFPPGETDCVMAQRGNQFCSLCRTILNLGADDTGEELAEVIHDFNRRYPE